MEKDYFDQNGILEILNNYTDDEYFSRHNKYHDPATSLAESAGHSDLNIKLELYARVNLKW